ncbi:hypothetical protein BLOT_003150 [Blomia tropicalis]|nr:hypothetical protein BLOT_003150 [Blomia tropicalis]
MHTSNDRSLMFEHHSYRGCRRRPESECNCRRRRLRRPSVRAYQYLPNLVAGIVVKVTCGLISDRFGIIIIWLVDIPTI